MWKSARVPLEAHPDKVCDRMVAAVVDEYLRRDPAARCDIQAAGVHGMVMLGGCVHSSADFDVAEVARRAAASTGLRETPEMFVTIEHRMPQEEEVTVIGYATRETREFLPPALVYAQTLARTLAFARRQDPRCAGWSLSGNVVVAMEGSRVAQVTMTLGDCAGMDAAHAQAWALEQIITPALPDLAGVQVRVQTNSVTTASGFGLRTGASDRHMGLDTYGGLLPWSAPGMWGKDPLHPAKAGTLFARAAARDLVAQGRAASALVTVVYPRGNAQPIVIARSGDGTDLTQDVQAMGDPRPAAIVERFSLASPIFAHIAAHGIFGRSDVLYFS